MPSIPIRSGKIELGSAAAAVSANAEATPKADMKKPNPSGAIIEPICIVAVLVVNACRRCVRGTTFAVMADLAGLPKTLVTPRTAVTA